MHFFSFGLNHHKANTTLRDHFVLSEAKLRQVYRSLDLSGGAGCVILSTCNRTECYLHGTEADVEMIQAAMGVAVNEKWPVDAAFRVKDEAAVLHTFQVTCGLNSMVLGDGQILSQVKDAYRIAVEENRVDAVLHRLMHTAFSTAKQVMNETRMMGGTASVAGTAAAITIQELSRLQLAEASKILVVGGGQMGRLVIEHLSKYRDLKLSFTNRSCERADAIVGQFPHVKHIEWPERFSEMDASDAVIVASGAEQHVVEATDLTPRPAKANSVLIIDIAMPRNVDPEINALPGYRVFDLDVLQHMIDDVLQQRKDEMPGAQEICKRMLADFVSWFFHHQAMQPAIQAILQTFDTIRLQEIERHQGLFSEIDYQQLDRITRSIMQKVLAVPVVRLKNVGHDHIDYINGVKLLQTLFARTSCEDPAIASPGFYEDIIGGIKTPEEANLSTLAACPFHEIEGDDFVT